MKLIRAKLISRIQRTRDVESFRFRPEEKIDFRPGQFLQLMFDSVNPDNKEVNKYLSFSSSPMRDYAEVTKKLSASTFSQKLRGLAINDLVMIKAPMGSCVFKDEYKKIGFLIGGIGITPVISILEYITEKKLATDVALFYSNRTEDDIAFRAELDSWQEANKNIRVFYTITDCQPVTSRCIFGRIDQELVVKKLNDYAQRVLFIFGPPVMVKAMNLVCTNMGCNQNNIKIENFSGY